MNIKLFCIPITFNNPLKVCFSNNKYTITTQTLATKNCKSIFLIKKPGFNCFSKIRPLAYTHEFLTIDILLYIKSENSIFMLKLINK